MNNENKQNIDTTKLELASTSKRIKAFVIDDLLISFIMILLLWDQIVLANGNFMEIAILLESVFLPVILIKILYQSFFIWYYGATLGKMSAKIKVIDFNNFGNVTFAQSVLRASGRILSERVYHLGFVLAFYTDSKQTFHDKVAKTLVINVTD